MTTPQPAPTKNLIMLSGDTVLATGRRGVFHQVLEILSRHFARIDVISPRPDGPITTRELFGNVFLHPSTEARRRQVGHILRVARKLLAERRYALATSHDYGFFYNGIAAYRLKREFGLPYLSEIHHVPGFPLPASMRERLDLMMARLYIPFAAKHAVAIRVVNRVEMPKLLESYGVPRSKIAVIPSLYLDHDIYRPLDLPKKYDVVCCGRLVPNKRFDLVIEALAVLRRMGRVVSMLLVGQGPLEAQLLAQIDRRGLRDAVTHVRFLPGPEDLARAYCESRMLVCASTSEGGPRVTCEAMGCGTPAISTPVGLMAELIEDGVSGLLFRWNAEELATAIAALLDDPEKAKAMGARGRDAVLPFRRETMIEGYAKAILGFAAEASQ